MLKHSQEFTFFNFDDMTTFLMKHQEYNNTFYVTLKDLTIVKMKFVDIEFKYVKLIMDNLLEDQVTSINKLKKYGIIYMVMLEK